MIRTIVLRIVFASSFFLVTLLLIFLLFHNSHENEMASYKLRVQAHVSWAIYGIAIASSLVMLYFPLAKYNLNDMWVFFASLNLSEIIRVALGYYILTIFPGYVAYRAFAQNKLNNSYEKLSVVLVLSYIISIVIGLSLSHTVGLTLVNYLCALWVFTLTCEVLHYLFKRKYDINAQQPTPNNFIKASLIISICLLLVFSSYLITLSAGPSSLALGGDVANYLSVSNAFVGGRQFDSIYIWFQIFIGIASVLTGLHPLHAFVGMQFLIILFPLSFYTLLLRVFKDDKLATIGTVVTTITCGLSSIGILGLFSAYNDQSVSSALLTLQTKTQNWPWLSNHFFIVATMDWSLLMLGFGFIYSFIEGKRSSRLCNLVFGSLFLASTFFTHSALGVIIFLTTISIFSVLDYKYMRRAALSFVITLLAIILFDALSYNSFINTLIHYYLHYQVFFASSSLFPYQWGIIALLTLSLLLLLTPRLARSIRKRIELMESSRLFSIQSISSICAIIAFLFSIASIAIIATHFNDLNYPEETIFPWYIYVLRFTPLLQLAILSIPLMLKRNNEKRLGAWLMMSWAVSAILVIGLNVFFPRFATSLVVNRVLMSTYLPLGALSALTLVSLNAIELPKVRLRFRVHIKKISICLLVVLLGFAFLSYAYSIEFFYQTNMLGQTSSEEKNLYGYLENLPPEKIFLTYSYSSYMSISSLTMHKTYAYYQYGTFVTWPTEILFETSSPEVAYYFLYKLGITDIALTKQDLATLVSTSNGTLVSMLNFLPIVFNNTFATVYSVPRYLLSESSNYVLIEPTASLNSELISKPLLYNPISLDNLRIVGGPTSFKLENNTIIQEVQNITPPSAQYLQLYAGIAIPTALSPTASFTIKGTGHALFNIGFYDANTGWVWLSHDQGLLSHFFNASNEWTTVNIDLSSILGKAATVLYIDFVVTSTDGSPVTVEWADFNIALQINANEMISSVYNLAYNALTINGVPFTTVEDNNVLKMTPNNVYIFSNSLPNDTPSNNLIDSVKTGAHAIFLYDSVASSKENQELLYSLGIESNGIISAKTARIAEEIISYPTDLYTTNLTTQNSPYPNNVTGYYTMLENKSVPLIITFAVGNGSIVLINLPTALNLDRALANIAVNTIKSVVAVLPGFIRSTMLKTLPHPEDLFKLGNPTLVNIYNLKGLTDYIYSFSDIKLEGNISISSDYIILNEKDLIIKKLVLQNTTYQESLENVSIANLNIAGFYNITLTTHDAIIYASGGELPTIKTSSLNSLRIYVDEPAISLTIKQNGAEKIISVSRSYVEFELTNNFTTKMTLQKPLIVLKPGSLDTSWEGVFWYNGKLFTTVSTAEQFPIIGSYSFQVVNVYNVGLLLINDIHDIRVEIKQTQYWTSG
jgi:hypothetical protein